MPTEAPSKSPTSLSSVGSLRIDASPPRISEAGLNSYSHSLGNHTAAQQHGMSQGAGQPLNCRLARVPGGKVGDGGFGRELHEDRPVLEPSPLPFVERWQVEPVGRRQEELLSLGPRRTETLVRCKGCPNITFTVRGKNWFSHTDIRRHLTGWHGATDRNIDKMIADYIEPVRRCSSDT